MNRSATSEADAARQAEWMFERLPRIDQQIERLRKLYTITEKSEATSV